MFCRFGATILKDVPTVSHPQASDKTLHIPGLVRRNWRTFLAVSAQVVDSILIAVSLLLAAKLIHQDLSIGQILATHGKLLVYSVFLIVVIFTALGIYRTVSYSTYTRQMFNAGRGLTYAAAIILSTLFISGNLFYNRNAVLLFLLFFVAGYAIVWLLLRRVMRALRSAGYGRWTTLVISSRHDVRSQVQRLEAHPELGFQVVGTLKLSPGADKFGRHRFSFPEVERKIRNDAIELIIFTSSAINGQFDQLQELCRAHRVRMLLLSPESNYLFRETKIRDLAGIPLFTPERRRIEYGKRLTKRAFDIIVASMLLAVFSPLFLLIAIATKLESHGPVFYKQWRALSDLDQAFQFYKFRSMHHRADEMKGDLVGRNITNGALFKIRNDPRLTRVGRFIRRYSIDELPQLLNVLRGEMSLVGPRPLPVGDFRRLLRKDHMGGYFRRRAHAKPGMTGLWQISGRSDLGFREMILLDLYYIDNQTILFDLEILAQTIPAVLFGKGAY